MDVYDRPTAVNRESRPTSRKRTFKACAIMQVNVVIR
jgi:hypothetical protein